MKREELSKAIVHIATEQAVIVSVTLFSRLSPCNLFEMKMERIKKFSSVEINVKANTNGYLYRLIYYKCLHRC